MLLKTQPQRGCGMYTIQNCFSYMHPIYISQLRPSPITHEPHTHLGNQARGPAAVRELQQLSHLSPVTL